MALTLYTADTKCYIIEMLGLEVGLVFFLF